ncbi:MAG: septal ring lytic transglycosylase RlpA family protein [Desulfobacteraceae bacterium]|nr:MAG: septal ring lytic transglycosylase RlpA family protein [Desulfobacteraceae bacterium]
MWPSIRGELNRSAVYAFLVLIALSLSGCALFQNALEKPPVAPEQPKPEAAEAVPPELPRPVEEPLVEKSGKVRRGKPYKVRGKTYHPLLTTDGYEERGIASWYGPSFHGRKTSCGETFDMHKVSAAHKLLPMHTKVKVTNLENGRNVMVTVNDRGPFVSGRILDLSYAAAKGLGIVEKGLARVLIRTAGKVQGQNDGDMVGEFFVHVGSFEAEADAIYLLEDMKSLRYKPFLIKVIRADRDGEIRWRVELGPYNALSDAKRAHSITIRDYPSAFLVANEPQITAGKEKGVIE